MVQQRSVQRLTAGLAAAGYVALAITILRYGVGDGEYAAASEYVVGYLFVAVLLAIAAGVGIFRDRSRRGAAIVVAGALVVAAGVMWGNVTGHDPSWFAAFGVPGNLAMLVGSVMIARILWRERSSARLLAAALALFVPAGLVGAEVGGGLLAALPWALVAAGVVAPREQMSERAESIDGVAVATSS